MSGRRLLRIAVWALILGLLVALPVGGQQRVSVELWFAALSLWLLIGLAIALLRAAPPYGGRSPSLLPVVARRLAGLRRRSQPPETSQLKDHRYIEALIRRSVTNERSHARRLRPRLQAIVDYHLFLRYGIDSTTDPVQAAAIHHELFGDAAWLIDPAVVDRTPTLEELDRFLRRMTGGADHR